MDPIIGILVILPLYSILYFGPAIIVGLAAKRRNRSFFKWFLLSFAAIVIPLILTSITDRMFNLNWTPDKSPYTPVNLALLVFVYYVLSKKPKRDKMELDKDHQWEKN